MAGRSPLAARLARLLGMALRDRWAQAWGVPAPIEKEPRKGFKSIAQGQSAVGGRHPGSRTAAPHSTLTGLHRTTCIGCHGYGNCRGQARTDGRRRGEPRCQTVVQRAPVVEPLQGSPCCRSTLTRGGVPMSRALPWVIFCIAFSVGSSCELASTGPKRTARLRSPRLYSAQIGRVVEVR